MRRLIVLLLALTVTACQGAPKKTAPTDKAGIAVVIEDGLADADAALRELVQAVPKGSTPVRIAYPSKRVDDLPAALRLAIDELAKIGTKRQVLVVIGGGDATDLDGFRAQVKRARAAKLETYALFAPLDVARANAVLLQELGKDGFVDLADRNLAAAAEELAKQISRPR